MILPTAIGAVVDGVSIDCQTPLSGQRSPVRAVVPIGFFEEAMPISICFRRRSPPSYHTRIAAIPHPSRASQAWAPRRRESSDFAVITSDHTKCSSKTALEVWCCSESTNAREHKSSGVVSHRVAIRVWCFLYESAVDSRQTETCPRPRNEKGRPKAPDAGRPVCPVRSRLRSSFAAPPSARRRPCSTPPCRS